MTRTIVQHPEPKQLLAYSNGQLAPGDQLAVAEHVAGCTTCQQRLTLANAPSVAAGPSLAGEAPSGHTGGGRAVPTEIPKALIDHPRYKVLGVLGAGGMGVVFKAEHRLMERLVALKVIHGRLIDEPMAVARFRREVKAAASLVHPNIVTAHDAEEAGGMHFLVTELVEGISLERRVEDRGPLTVPQACNFIRQAALGLQVAADKGMVHRDIKPQNLMITPDGVVKILDFGLARFAREAAPPGPLGVLPDAVAAGGGGNITRMDVVLGTPDYIAPEQVNDSRQADIRADIYSLGCTLYYLLVGRPPFAAKTLLQKLSAHLDELPPPVRTLRDDVPREIDAILLRMMAKQPAHRYQSPAEVAAALAPFAAIVEPNLGKSSGTATVPRVLLHGDQAGEQTLAPYHSETMTFERPRPTLPAAAPARPGWHWIAVVAAGLLVMASAVGLWTAFAGTPNESIAIANELPVEPTSTEVTPAETINVPPPISETTPAASPESTEPQRNSNELNATTSRVIATPTATTRPRVLLVVPQRGVWYPDYGPLRSAIERAGVDVTVASTVRGTAQVIAEGGGRAFTVDTALSNVRADDIQGICFIGYEVRDFVGNGSQVATVRRLLNDLRAQDKYICAICAGNAVLANAGVLRNTRATFSQMAVNQGAQRTDANWVNESIVTAGRILTARDQAAAPDFGQLIGTTLARPATRR